MILGRQNKWKRVSDKKGFEPAFDMLCPFCKVKFTLRTSEMIRTKRSDNGRRTFPTIKVMYKCISCATAWYFHIEPPYMTEDYWTELIKRRNGYTFYVPLDDWNDDKIIQKRLKELGYWGGDTV